MNLLTFPNPRPASPPFEGAVGGVSTSPPADSARPLLTGTRPAGSMRHHDDLVEALAAYRSTWARPDYLALRAAAERCGLPDGEPPMSWAIARVASYARLMGRA